MARQRTASAPVALPDVATLRETPMLAGIVAVAVAAPAFAKTALTCLGFTKVGIAAGSLAAAVQSVIYGGLVPAGGLFALLQSCGMTFSVVKVSATAVGSYACWLVGKRASG